MTHIYSLEHFNKIKQNGFSYQLPSDTQELIMRLSKLVGSPDYIKTPIFQKKKRDNNEPDWELLKKFKPTAKVERSDNEKLIQSIKGSLNKLTDKNYNTMRDDIFSTLEKLENTDEYDLVLDIIFNIASSNRFYSKVYASLYKELMERSSAVFTERINLELTNYIERFLDVKNVNANENYEEFCENNKKNEERKALTEFFIHLMSMNVITKERIVDLFNSLIDLVNKHVTDQEHKATIVELSENIFIFMNCGISFFNEAGLYENMIIEIKDITKMKVKDYPGLSNKSLFKFMDIMDIK